MKFAFLRWLPGLLVAALLLVALLAPVRRVGARSGPVADAAFQPSCDLLLQQNGGASGQTLTSTLGVSQPFLATSNVAACSLSLDPPGYSFSRLDIIAFNPASLAPDPTRAALRSNFFNNSALEYTHVKQIFDPPLVLREEAGVAEPFSAGLAMDYTVTSGANETARYDPDGSPSAPAALQFVPGSPAARVPLAGNHPVLNHQVCSGSSALQALRVVQSVAKSSTTIGGPGLYEVAQRFRVPVATDLHWVEFATTPGASDGFYNWGVVMLFDATGMAAPPAQWPTSLIQTAFNGPYGQGPCWQSHFDFDHTITLEAEHDYWLMLRTSGDYTLEIRQNDGSEGSDFSQRIGPFFRRNVAGDAWVPLASQSLDFRIIGQPVSSVGVGAPAPARAGFRLAIAPSPSRGAVQVEWTGARGAVSFDVLDARGRRVAGGEGASQGRWSWNAAGLDGRALPAGVYFVRARDASGQSASGRAVLVR